MNINHHIINCINRQKGIASIEFAYMVVPILLIFYIGFDISLYIQTKSDLDKVNYSLNTLASKPALWAKDEDGNIVEGLDKLDIAKYQKAAAGLLGLESADYNRVGVKASYVTETAINHKQSGNCATDNTSSITNANDLFGPKHSSETQDRKAFIMQLCYRIEFLSLAQRILETSLLDNEIHSYSFLIQR